ncbi:MULTISPECIES: Mth938-like domain-containing protein [Halocynthiibacter]|uniref:Mth938-like domain-containing protein n=1 Tax=Halocynthiibacter halioticoli TaxID=2986804 RepID=A0AAE3J010_9RHOB|nr:MULTISPECIES: Mth938-like domain-containing protein [Halocynthiibacter]MCV6824046.1 Mth938-like domain-containing protein [Halocynthiibacter halioticoli]MCW4057047.1 Mth938-like domain-containing protein [Halocynthiibacter sp. SDUM655004]MDE0589927.1 Mth938-like domain-containing protein [Halocynthiibacter sp. C4]
MKFTEVSYGDLLPVDGYGPGFFRIGGEKVEGPMAIMPSGRIEWGGYEDSDALVAEAGNIDVLFFGTGTEIAYLPKPLKQALEAAGIGVELMATPAACRTYNVLLSEGRRVGIAAIPVS